MHVAPPLTHALPLIRDHLPQGSDFSCELVKVLAHVVTLGLGTDGCG